MMYNYLKLDDETQIAYSDPQEDGTVRIAVERPVDGGFDAAFCSLPLCQWHDTEGFTREELNFLTDIVRNNAPLIYRLSREAGKGSLHFANQVVTPPPTPTVALRVAESGPKGYIRPRYADRSATVPRT